MFKCAFYPKQICPRVNPLFADGGMSGSEDPSETLGDLKGVSISFFKLNLPAEVCVNLVLKLIIETK
jgi:hypothetical protein